MRSAWHRVWLTCLDIAPHLYLFRWTRTPQFLSGINCYFWLTKSSSTTWYLFTWSNNHRVHKNPPLVPIPNQQAPDIKKYIHSKMTTLETMTLDEPLTVFRYSSRPLQPSCMGDDASNHSDDVLHPQPGLWWSTTLFGYKDQKWCTLWRGTQTVLHFQTVTRFYGTRVNVGLLSFSFCPQGKHRLYQNVSKIGRKT